MSSKIGSKKSPSSDNNYAMEKFQRNAKNVRESGQVRYLAPGKKIPTKRSARTVIKQIEDGTEDYIFSSKLAISGDKKAVIEFLKDLYKNEPSNEEIEEILGMKDEEFPLISSSEEINQGDLEKIKGMFKDLNIPMYNIFDFYQIKEKLREQKISDGDLVGAPYSSRTQTLFKRLTRLYDQNQKRISEGKDDDVRYLRLTGVANGCNPAIVKPTGTGKRSRAVFFKTEITVEQTTFTMYLQLGSFRDNQKFIQNFARELKVDEEEVFGGILQEMKEQSSIRRAPKPSSKRPGKTPAVKNKPKVTRPSRPGKTPAPGTKGNSKGTKPLPKLENVELSQPYTGPQRGYGRRRKM